MSRKVCFCAKFRISQCPPIKRINWSTSNVKSFSKVTDSTISYSPSPNIVLKHEASENSAKITWNLNPIPKWKKKHGVNTRETVTLGLKVYEETARDYPWVLKPKRADILQR